MKKTDGKTIDPNARTSAQGQKSSGTPTKIDASELEKIVSGAYFSGKKDARLLVVEYSDMECPYCIHHDQSKTIENLLKEHPDSAFIFKNNRGVGHPGTEAKGLALLCAGELGGSDTYYIFMHTVFGQSSDPLNPASGGKQDVYPVAKLPELAESLGIKTKDFEACTKDTKSLDRFNMETAQASAFGLKGTPGTLLVDTKTMQYVVVSGARDIAFFRSEVQRLLAEIPTSGSGASGS